MCNWFHLKSKQNPTVIQKIRMLMISGGKVETQMAKETMLTLHISETLQHARSITPCFCNRWKVTNMWRSVSVSYGKVQRHPQTRQPVAYVDTRASQSKTVSFFCSLMSALCSLFAEDSTVQNAAIYSIASLSHLILNLCIDDFCYKLSKPRINVRIFLYLHSCENVFSAYSS